MVAQCMILYYWYVYANMNLQGSILYYAKLVVNLYKDELTW